MISVQIFLQEKLNLQMWIGALLITLGAALVGSKFESKKKF